MRRGLGVVLLIATACSSGGANPSAGPPPCRAKSIIGEGEHIPTDCRFARLGGGELSLAELRGKPALLNFWASWCPNCLQEMPALERAHSQLGDKVRFLGVDLLGVNGEIASEAERYARKRGVTYEIIEDSGGLLAAHFTVRLLPPMTILVDAAGIVRFRKFGQLEDAEITSTVQRYLGVS